MPEFESQAASASAIDESESIDQPGDTSVNGTNDDMARTEAATPASDAGQPDYQAALLVDFARAMHNAADVRRERAIEAVDRLRATQVEQIQNRGVAEAESAREEADADIAAVRAWAEAEIDRILAERERRGQARQRELEALLERYDAQIEWEIGAVESAVSTHRAELDEFFERLGAETDATVIARLALEAPELPRLDEVTAAARARAAAVGSSIELRSMTQRDESPAAEMTASADGGLDADVADARVADARVADAPVAEASTDDARTDETWTDDRPLVGVMDPAAIADDAPAGSLDVPSAMPGASPIERLSFSSEGGSSATVDGAAESAAPPAEAGTDQPTPVAAGSGALLQAIPALRPVAAWLNHGNEADKRE